MLSVKVIPSQHNLFEVELLKDNVLMTTVDDTLTAKQAEKVRYHIDYLLDRLNYLEPLQAKYEEKVSEEEQVVLTASAMDKR